MRIALITYHHAYNFGSVLQAYATQKAIDSLGHQCEIIDYRMPFQDEFYGLLGYGEGLKGALKKVAMATCLRERKLRQARYESFITESLDMTERFNDPMGLEGLSDRYDAFVSGSDQIWNIHSNEFLRSGYEFMFPYLLAFTDKPKISYASSVASSTADEVRLLKGFLDDFTAISCRERPAAKLIGELLDRDVSSVLDPTFLVPGEAWREVGAGCEAYADRGDYYLYYSLKSMRRVRADLHHLVALASRESKRLIAIAPLCPPLVPKGVDFVSDVGPREFIGLIDGAHRIFTDSYHGSVFSVILEKDFVFLRHPRAIDNCRAEDMLDRLGLLARMGDLESCLEELPPIDYSLVRPLREAEIALSIDYLKSALDACGASA